MENTSYISRYSYTIESFLYQGMSIEEIQNEIEVYQGKGIFPKNLQLVDAYLDKSTSSSGCAFLDTNTGKTIVGFAGTNVGESVDGIKDVLTDVSGLGVSGIGKDSIFMRKPNEFIDNLKEKGYNITQTTGHSLGGALCTYAAIYHNIPGVVTYNGAPLYVSYNEKMDDALNIISRHRKGNIPEIDEAIKNYNGRVIRFVSTTDPLNIGMGWINGYYMGTEIKIDNWEFHGIAGFIRDGEQRYISRVLLANEIYSKKVSSVDFDGDGKVDISLTDKDLMVKNLFGVGGLYSGNGVDIKIDPQAFYNLSASLKQNMAGSDVDWINTAIKLCTDKNDLIKNDKSEREDTLCSRVVDSLNRAGLTRLVCAIDESHGELVRDVNKNIIEILSTFNTYDITRKFDGWGTSAGRRWFINGESLDQNDLMNCVKELKNSAGVLYHTITTSGEIPCYGVYYGNTQSYRFETLSDIGKSFVDFTNSFLSETEKAFKGTGLRSGKNDGIVNSISEVLEFEVRNISELQKQIFNIAEMSQGLGGNFDNMEEWLSKDIEEGKINGKYDFKALPSSYTAYLEENKIFDDVKDVLEAYDIQVEEASEKLAKSIVLGFEILYPSAKNRLTGAHDAIECFMQYINKLKGMMNKTITSKKNCIDNLNPLVSSTVPATTEITTNHGTLRDMFPSNIARAIEYSNIYIIPLLYPIYDAKCFLDSYNSAISNLKEDFKSIIELAVYDSMELTSIIQAEGLISLRIDRMINELKQVSYNLRVQYKGQSIDAYITQLDSMIKSLEYFNLMINDCFGTNLESNK